jgi:isoprenylcysteine carboxyl methyltransferase (ICMT) family protein YpbQ
VTFKQDHELIESGPYALARHPIYTGLIVTAVGTHKTRVHASIPFVVLLRERIPYLAEQKTESLACPNAQSSCEPRSGRQRDR